MAKKDSFAVEITRLPSELLSQRHAPRIYSLYYLVVGALIIGLNLSYYVLAHYGWMNFWTASIVTVLLAMVVAVAGLSVAHESNHDSTFRSRALTRTIGFIFYDLFYGTSSFYWRKFHNASHHVNTNFVVKGEVIDPDMRVILGIRRMVNRFPYRLRTLGLLLVLGGNLFLTNNFLDWRRFFSGVAGIKHNSKERIALVLGKICFNAYAVVLPVYYFASLWPIVIFVAATSLTSIFLSVVFLIAHSNQRVYAVDATLKADMMSWEMAQVITSANYAMKSRLVTLLHGGLNYQIEHHLFPNIHPAHYPALSEGVRRICAKYNVPYVVYETTRDGVADAFRFMTTEERGNFDEKNAVRHWSTHTN